MNPDPSVVIPNAVKATLNILKAASKRPTVKQVVLTSSSTAAYTPNANGERTTITQGAPIEEHLFHSPPDEFLDTWNDAAVEAAWDENAPPHSKGYFVYVASKTETEREAFKWIEETKPHFIFNTVLPALTVNQFSFLMAMEILLTWFSVWQDPCSRSWGFNPVICSQPPQR